MSDSNPNDEARRHIVEYFYKRNANANSRFGKRGSAVKISEVKRELKELHGLTQAEVVSNLNYLLDRGWVKSIEQKKEVNTNRGTTVPSVVSYYEISAKAIDRIEGGSAFQPPERYPGINIQAMGSNVITLGDGNVVNVAYESVFNNLTDLKERISESERLPEDQKFSVAVDIETLKDQLAKREPDSAVVKPLWSRIQNAAALAGLSRLAIEITQQLANLIS